MKNHSKTPTSNQKKEIVYLYKQLIEEYKTRCELLITNNRLLEARNQLLEQYLYNLHYQSKQSLEDLINPKPEISFLDPGDDSEGDGEWRTYLNF